MNYSDNSDILGNTVPYKYVEGNSSVKIGSDLHDEDYIFDNQYVRFSFFFLYTIVFSLCFFGNLAVVLVVTLHWKMRSITKFCLGNLAFANLCVGIFCVYQNLTTFLIDRWVFGHFMCKMYHFINSLSHTASILILVVICVERYLAILHPFKNRHWITRTRLRIAIVTVWILSAVLCSPRLYYINTYYIRVPGPADGEVRYDMICAPQQTLYDAPIVDTVYFILLFLLPLIVISILYTHIGIHLCRDNDLIANKLPSTYTLHSFRPKRNSEHISFSSDSASTSSENRRNSCKLKQISIRCSPPKVLVKNCSFSRDAKSVSCKHKRNEVLKKIRFEIPRRDAVTSPVSENNTGNLKERKGEKVSANSHTRHNRRRRKGRCEYASAKFHFKTKFQCSNDIEDRNSWEREKQESLLKGKVVRKSSPSFENPNAEDDIKTGNTTPKKAVCRESNGCIPKESFRCKVLERTEADGGMQKNRCIPRLAVLRMLIVIVATFAICNLPFHLRKLCMNFLPSYDMGSNFSNLLTPLTFLFMYTNCAINPIIYAFMSKDFRSSLLDLLRGQLKRKVLKKRHTTVPV